MPSFPIPSASPPPNQFHHCEFRVETHQQLSRKASGVSLSSQVYTISQPPEISAFLNCSLSMWFLWQEYWSGLPFPPLVDHDLSELFTITCLFWVALQGKAHSFIELCKLHRHHKAVIRDKPRQRNKKQRHHFADKGPSSQSYGFSRSHVWMRKWTIKKAEC